MDRIEAVTCDIDSTIADTSIRADKMINKFNRHLTDWEAYALACESDTPTDTVELVRLLSQNYIIVLVSARPKSSQKVTMEWLEKYDIPYDYLVLDEGYHDSIIDYKVAAVSQVNEAFPVKLHIDDWWGIGEAVKESLGIPTVIVRSYAPKDNKATF